MKALTLVDMGFLYTETVTSPKHVAGLQIFSIPDNYQGHFTRDIFDVLMSHEEVKKPFNYKVKTKLSGLMYWQEDNDVDLSYHVRFAMLPQPGNSDQLLSFVEHQHEGLLDRHRPLWELTLIDGLANNQFAVYIKAHHAFADGAKINQILLNYLNTDKKAPLKPFWSMDNPDSVEPKNSDNLLELMSKTSTKLSKQVQSIPSLTKLTAKLIFQGANIYNANMPTPFRAPKTPFSISPKRARRAAITSLPLARVKRLGRMTGATINDVVVSVCDMALHNYLANKNFELKKPLVAQMPINLREDNDKTSNNKIAISLVELAYSGEHPLERLMTIKESCLKLKKEALHLSDEALTNYSMASQGLAVISELLKLDTILPPMGNVLISNVPGPQSTLYMMGAKMETCFPLSALPPGMSLNITLFSYTDSINIGLIGCRAVLPDLTHIAAYIENAFQELENAVVKTAAISVSEQIAQIASGSGHFYANNESMTLIDSLLLGNESPTGDESKNDVQQATETSSSING
jgi:diacylglycerol O-acyltransferase